MGFGSVREVGKKNKQRTKRCYNYNTGSNGLRALLPELLPFLREKKELAIRMLAYLDTTTPQTAGLQGQKYYEAREQAKQFFFEEVARRKHPSV